MRYLLFSLVLVLASVPAVVQAQSIGTIIPAECKCEDAAPAYGCILQTIQNIVKIAIEIGFVIFTLALVYAGFVWMTSGGKPERRQQGKNLLLNTFVGIFIMLAAWLIVDFVLKTLYREPREFGPWNSILVGTGASENNCLVPTEPRPITEGSLEIIFGQSGAGGGDIVPVTEPLPGADNKFTYQSGISTQLQHASPRLKSLLSCMAARVPANVGEISSISDSAIVSGSKTWSQCAAGQCQHSANSCHYGGRTCVGSSYAVDFGDERNSSAIRAAAAGCGAKSLYEGDHVHVSIGEASGCGCSI